ncbi:MAG: hypothetical protein NTZ12_12040 [Candidatus Aminicenantes bacterium]|nr:hypothetical protein [Candidatus Aminicenantes bacterium]
MKKFSFSALAIALLLLPCLQAFADVALLDTEKNKLQLTGFFKLDAVYQDAGVNGLTIPRYAVAGDGNAYLSATHSRIGFKYIGTPLANGMTVSALLEMDFLDTTSPTQMKPRFRQGFFSLQKNGHALLFGQAWDLFSPLGPTTLMTNGYLWQTGNLGFRHAQVRYSYSAPRLDFGVSVSDPASTGGWAAMTPVLQARLGLKLGAGNKFQLGLSGIYGRESASSAAAAFKNKVNISGLGLDWNLAFCKTLSLKGEYAMGGNLIYLSSRSATFADMANGEFAAKKVSAFWSELLLAKNKLSGWLGYAFEDLNDEAQLAANELKKTNCLLAGIQYAAGSGVSFGLEFAHFLSQNFQSNETKTNQLIFSAFFNL